MLGGLKKELFTWKHLGQLVQQLSVMPFSSISYWQHEILETPQSQETTVLLSGVVTLFFNVKKLKIGANCQNKQMQMQYCWNILNCVGIFETT